MFVLLFHEPSACLAHRLHLAHLALVFDQAPTGLGVRIGVGVELRCPVRSKNAGAGQSHRTFSACRARAAAGPWTQQTCSLAGI